MAKKELRYLAEWITEDKPDEVQSKLYAYRGAAIGIVTAMLWFHGGLVGIVRDIQTNTVVFEE